MFMSSMGQHLMEQAHGVLVRTVLDCVIFGVDYSSSFHKVNCENNVLVLGDISTYRNNGIVSEKSLVLT